MSKINELLPLHNVQYEKIRTYWDVQYGKNTLPVIQYGNNNVWSHVLNDIYWEDEPLHA
jgi:hypothetical protein